MSFAISGLYCICIPVALNLATLTGYCIIQTVVAGQTLAAVGDGTLTPNVGIVIVAFLGMGIGFCGIKVLHQYERFAWIPAVIIIIIATGCGGKHLSKQQIMPEPGAPAILSFAALIAGFLIPWGALASDYVTYMDPNTPR